MPKDLNIFNQTVLIRSFRDADQRAAKDLIILGLAEHFDYIDPALNPDIDDIETHYLQNGDVFIVAERGDRLVATLGLVYVNNYQAKIVRMSVLKGHRRQGTARSLLEYCIQSSATAVNSFY
ncbi:MAG: GNAT family N-acetyltransferase [Pseudomonadales bacterium]|nr:GNAT family N-acetyltransferase [Pseudomonadales bacterium]